MKANQPELLEALEEWIDFRSQQRGDEVAHWVEVVKGHGRMERREGWMVPWETEMQADLRDEFGWPGVQWCGRIRRQRWTPEKGEGVGCGSHIPLVAGYPDGCPLFTGSLDN